MDSSTPTPDQNSEDGWRSEVDVDSENGLLIEKGAEEKQDRRYKSKACHWTYLILILTVFNIAIFTGTVITALYIHRKANRHTEFTTTDALKKIKAYSKQYPNLGTHQRYNTSLTHLLAAPVLNHITPEFKDLEFNGSLFNNPPSIYRSDPSPAVNAAWDAISDIGWFLITEPALLAMGKDPSISARASTALVAAMGKDPSVPYYLTQLDAFHQLHCLNEIRHHVYWDHFLAPKWGAYDAHTPHPLHWTHVSHCLNTIRQNLMCSADLEMISGTWMVGQDYSFPDFSLQKKCKDFGQLQEYQERERVPRDLEAMMMTPSDVEKKKMPLEAYYALGEEVPEDYVYDHEVDRENRNWDSSW